MDGRRLFLVPLLACVALALALVAAGAAPASAADSPSVRWPVGGSTLRTAVWLGGEHWGMTPCRGRVALSWESLGPATNAQSTWANDLDPYLQPSSNTDCEIALSLQVDWDWPKLCTVIVHEVGHLTGHDHVDDAEDVMYATYVTPVPECASTPEPVETGPPPAPAAPAAKTKAKESSAKRTATKKPRKRGASKKRRAAQRRR